MSGDRPAAETVPIDAIPEPVAGYDQVAEEPTVAVANEAFAASFGESAIGDSVEQLLLGAGATEDTAAAVRAALVDGRSVDIELGGGPAGAADAADGYRIRTLDGAGNGAVEGYVLLTERSGGGVGVDAIASVVSHDLRNPLDVANAHLRAARDTGDDEHFEQVRRSHDRMERIVRDVLTLARGPAALDTDADVDVGSVARDAWATVETGEATLAVADDLPTVEADPDRLRRLFENLFRNAVEHGPTAPRDGDRAADLRVAVGAAEDGGFFVADDGVGVPPAERERVFDPGYSAADGEGTGLGLTIVERIAEAHGWRVSLASGDAGGARFEFRLGETDGVT
jgi:signal transduction histidine kinase